jgi:hypothetical protein
MGVCGFAGYVCFGSVVLESIQVISDMLFAFAGFVATVAALYVASWFIMRGYKKQETKT